MAGRPTLPVKGCADTGMDDRAARKDTAATIGEMFEPVLRNCMIEIMTPERFVKTGVVGRVAEDDTGVLWRKLWSFRGVTIGS